MTNLINLPLAEVDPLISNAIDNEVARQANGLELIASENFVSEAVLEAMGSVFTNKYAEGYPGKRYYGGCEYTDVVEQAAIDRAKELFGADHANVQPHSGAQANMSVYLAAIQYGDTILSMNLSHGGHLTHGHPLNFSGLSYKVFDYGVSRETETIDYDELQRLAEEHKPKLLVCGASAYPRIIDFKRIGEIAQSVGARMFADIAHIAGPVVAQLHPSPVPHADYVTTTTHKTLRGPRGGIIMLRHDFENPWGIKDPKGNTRTMSQLLDLAVFPGTQGGPLEHIIAAKAVAFGEILTDEFSAYAKQIIANAQAMAKAFVSRGYNLISNGTDSHLMLIDVRNKNLTGKKAQETLDKAHITLNKNADPFDDKSPFVTSGIRVGVPAVTTRGMKERDMETIVTMIDRVLMNADDEKVIRDTKEEVREFMQQYPLYPELG